MAVAALDFAAAHGEGLPITTSDPAANTPVLRLVGAIGEGEPISASVVEGFLSRSDASRGMRIEIDSHGGEHAEAMKIYAILRASPAATWMHVEHQCASAAILVYAAAAFRTAAPGARFLLHSIRIPRAGLEKHLTARDLRRHAADLEQLDNDMAVLLARRTGYDVCWFAKQLENEEPTSVPEMFAAGIVHEICGLTLPISSQFLRSIPELSARRIFLPHDYDTPNFWAAAAAADHFRNAHG